MSEALYGRYKDALRRGHVAALRGRLDAALVAYSEAAQIAPERALPQASLASVLAKLGRPDEALAAYGLALDRAPSDEASLAGRADLLASLGRRSEAADSLDRLASVHEAAERLPEACDTARRALELAESRPRRRHVEALARRLREVPADEAAAAALERALGILDTSVPTPELPDADAVATDAQAESARDPEPKPEPEPEPVDALALSAEAEDRLDEGDAAGARAALLAAAAAHRAAGHVDAAIDACYLALSVAPADQELHVALAELYLDRGWKGHATEKLLLLDRLGALQEDEPRRERIRALIAERLPDEPRLAALRG